MSLLVVVVVVVFVVIVVVFVVVAAGYDDEDDSCFYLLLIMFYQLNYQGHFVNMFTSDVLLSRGRYFPTKNRYPSLKSFSFSTAYNVFVGLL